MSSKTFNNTKINVEFDEDYQSRTNINSGENISSLFAKIRRFILDLKAVCFSGSYNDLSDTPDVVTKEYVDPIKSQAAINRTTLGVQCKNLLKNNAVTTTKSGITFTVNDDKSVTVNGTNTSSSSTYIQLCGLVNYGNSKLIASIGQNTTDVYMAIYDSDWNWIGTGSAGTISFENSSKKRLVRLVVKPGVTINNVTFYPMLRYADIPDSTYEPYKESVDERLIQNKSDIAVNKSTLGYQRKNILDETGYLSSITSVTRGTKSISGNQITLTATAADCYTKPNADSDGGFRISVEPNTDYILSWESDNSNSGNVYIFMNGTTDGRKSANNNGSKTLKFTTNSDTTFITIRLGVANSGDSITYSNIMLRYADILDDTYEPYQPSVQDQIIGTYFPMTNSKGLANNTDLNTITEIGNYACYTGGSAATMTNCPTKAGGFRLIVTNLIVSTNKSSTIRYQWIIPNNLDGILCFRRKFDISTNTFNSWYSFGGTVVS